MRKSARILLLFFITLCSFKMTFSQDPSSKKTAETQEELHVLVVPDKVRYSKQDKMMLRALLINMGSEDLFVYRTLDWGVAGSFSLCVFTEDGRAVGRKFVDTGRTFPPPDSELTRFIKLSPYQLFGGTYQFQVSELDIRGPGRYSIVVEYHPPIQASQVMVKPFFGKERGVIRSAPAFIRIR